MGHVLRLAQAAHAVFLDAHRFDRFGSGAGVLGAHLEDLVQALGHGEAGVDGVDVDVIALSLLGERLGEIGEGGIDGGERFRRVVQRRRLGPDVGVLQDYRRRGVGDALMRAAESYARQHGARWFRVNVLAANAPALRLYERAGFEARILEMEKMLEST